MPNKAFLEITNVCNLSCSFCHGTKRSPRYMTVPEFTHAAEELRSFAEYLYFHLMGEPLLHPSLSDFLKIASSLGFKVILTTNGTLLKKRRDILLGENPPYKISVSLHSFEANEASAELDGYLDKVFEFCTEATEKGIICVMRLWNIGGENSFNQTILDKMHMFFGKTEWKEIYSGYKIKDKIFLEWGERFDWPDEHAEECSDSHFCYGLRDQIAVLCDGTVVPCCLDAEGSVNLGNIFEKPLSEILEGERASALKKSFEKREIKEPLCRRCGYAAQKGYRSGK